MEVEDFKVGEECLVRARASDTDGATVGFDTFGLRGECLHEHSFRLLATELDAVVKGCKPKYDPFRKFRKGDVVRVVARDGRNLSGFPAEFIQAGDMLTVAEDEDFLHVDTFTVNGRRVSVVWFCLELVTPVEEIPTYRVGDFATNGEICVWRNQGGKTEKVCSFNVNTHPNAKAAAEAERDRLNDAWREGVKRRASR